jgi:peptidoglycan-associated lipoprotein
MKKRLWMVLVLLLLMPALMTMGCSKKQVQPDVSLIGTDEDQYDAARQRAMAEEEEARRRTLEEQHLLDEQRLMDEQRRQALLQRQQLIDEDIYFDFDQSVIRPDAQDVLRKKAEFLRENPGVSVVIEAIAMKEEQGNTTLLWENVEL